MSKVRVDNLVFRLLVNPCVVPDELMWMCMVSVFVVVVVVVNLCMCVWLSCLQCGVFFYGRV